LDRDELIRRLMATFRVELDEHSRVFNRELLALEREPHGPGALESIKLLFRSAHSLKGAAHAVGQSELEQHCHSLEELLAGLRDGRRALDPELFAELFAAVDRVSAAGHALAASSAAPAPPPAPAPETPLPARHSLPPASDASERPPPARSAEPEPSAESVRVPGRRLDALLAQSGELQIARLRLDVRREELHALQELVTRLRHEWRGSEWSTRRARARGEASESAAGKNGASKNGAGKNGASEPNGASGGNGGQVASARTARAIAFTRQSLARLDRELERFSSAFAEDMRVIDRAATPLREQIHQARLLPFVEACEGLPRMLRDLLRQQGKEAELVIEGAETELDRSLIDGARDALVHLVRNAVDHGLEPPDERRARGKPARGRIVLAATLRGETVAISVSDDGRGIDEQAVRGRAFELGIEAPDDARALLRLLFVPGFSTAREVTHVSGRGVGLDVVQARVEVMRGTVEVDRAPGGGARFTLTLPLTLSTVRAVFVRAGGEVLALPATSVQRMLRAGPEHLRSIEGREHLALAGNSAPVPLCALGGALALGTSSAPLSKVPLVLVEAGGRQAAFTVDELLGQHEVVARPLGRRLGRMRWVSAATLLPTGRIALLLQPSALIDAAYGERRAEPIALRFASGAKAVQKRLLLVDDSVTTRTLEKSILEAAGYAVLTASDGSAAWHLLQEHGADLVLSDVEMPSMDGFALAQAIRSSKRFRDLPVVLLTARGDEADRARGLEAGADAYLVKSAFDQRTLLETLRQLL
jgi:two-component system chemotaxis sensor kinase CheA